MTASMTPLVPTQPLNVEDAVRDRYSAAAQEREAALCCPVQYDARYLERIPQEIIDRDYGCGDPSQYVQAGDTVLDLGSGGGKICYIAAQVVGATGSVIGVDMNDDMLRLARQYQPQMAAELGYDNVRFHKGKIQDLQLSFDQLDQYLAEHPVQASSDWLAAESHAQSLRENSPMIPSESVDVVVSNCVLNLVKNADRQQLFREIHRVLRRGGRAVISDIVSDEDVPESLRNDPKLWSGCMSGAFREDQFLKAFEDAGFYGIEILKREDKPWAVVSGIEFRSLTVRAWKGKEGPCFDRRQAVIYRGPWKSVVDDNGLTLLRGERMAVCDKNFQLYTSGPYSSDILPVAPNELIPLSSAKLMPCSGTLIRDPRETKAGMLMSLDLLPTESCCGPGTGCC